MVIVPGSPVTVSTLPSHTQALQIQTAKPVVANAVNRMFATELVRQISQQTTSESNQTQSLSGNGAMVRPAAYMPASAGAIGSSPSTTSTGSKKKSGKKQSGVGSALNGLTPRR